MSVSYRFVNESFTIIYKSAVRLSEVNVAHFMGKILFVQTSSSNNILVVVCNSRISSQLTIQQTNQTNKQTNHQASKHTHKKRKLINYFAAIFLFLPSGHTSAVLFCIFLFFFFCYYF